MKNTEIAKHIAELRTQIHCEGTRTAATRHINAMVEARPGKLARKLALQFVNYAKEEIAKQNEERAKQVEFIAKYGKGVV